MMIDVTALGELLVDFTPHGRSQAGNEIFERNPGGAPANVLAELTKLGGKGAFIGKVGNDHFGNFLKEVLNNAGIISEGLKFSDDANTTLAFVHLDDKGDRNFSFYRKPGADLMLEEKDIDFKLIDDAAIFHFGSLSMTDEPARSATFKAVEYAKQKGKLISYDPNWRPPLWRSPDEAKQMMSMGVKYADILKVSDDEMELLTGEKDLGKGSKILFEQDVTLVIVTLGARGCYYRFAGGTGHINTYDTKVVDTTGSGDAFTGAMLYNICRLGKPLSHACRDDIEKILDFANAAGALCASKKGAIPAMPTVEEVQECMRNIPRLIIR